MLLGVTLGTLISAAIVWLRPLPTGIAEVEIIELHNDRAAGQSWVLELEADRTGYPFLIHLDKAGRASLLFPEGEIMAIGPGERRRLPDASGQRGWRNAGGEIWVTLSSTPYLALDRLFAMTERAADDATTEAAARRAARKVLRRQLGPGVTVRLPDGD
ncbi:hypothetical protein DRQ53_07885 [bacterium]|nr:MAG: hypothetical protein DRQ53_07885 [bacterium]